MAYESRKKKISTFAVDDALTDASTLDFIKNGINKKTSWANIRNKLSEVFGLSARIFSTEADLIASDIAIGEYAIVEENNTALYKITSLAANSYDVTLTSGFTASLEGPLLLEPVADYTALRAINTNGIKTGQTLSVTNSGIGSDGVLRNVVAHGLTDNGGTIIVISADWYWERSYSGGVDAAWFSSGSVDNVAVQAAGDYVETLDGVALVLSGDISFTAGVTLTKPITIISNANITLPYSFNGIALEWGEAGERLSPTASKNKPTLIGKLSIFKTRDVSNQPRWWTDAGSDTSVGLKIWNSSEGEFGQITVDGFKQNVVWASDHVSGFVRNKFRGLYASNGAENVKAMVSGVGYVNENTVIGGSLGNSTSTPGAVQSIITSLNLNSGGATFVPNGNKFHGVSMENSVSDTVIDIEGFHNEFRACRFEGVKSGSIVLGANSYDNFFDNNFGAAFAQSAFDDLSGGRNTFSGAGVQYHYSFSGASGVYTGKNFTVAADGGKAKYPIFTTFHHGTSSLSAAISEAGLMAFNSTDDDFPTFYADGESKKVWFGSGFFDIETGQSLRAATNRHEILFESAEASDGYANLRRAGSWEYPEKIVAGAITFYEWYDTSGNKRGNRSAPTSATDGVIISANPVT